MTGPICFQLIELTTTERLESLLKCRTGDIKTPFREIIVNASSENILLGAKEPSRDKKNDSALLCLLHV